MTAPNPTRQREGWATIDKLFQDADRAWVIHYSCESFYDRPDGRSPRVTSIAVRNLRSAQTKSFSIHKAAERRGVPPKSIVKGYDALEKEMLEGFFAFVGSHLGARYLHWNMRDSNYGFAAIEHRFIVLGGTPVVIADADKFDVSRLLVDLYGKAYISHPRLESLMKLNKIEVLDFLSGKEEAAAFDNQDYARLHQSTLRKTHVIANIAEQVHHRQLMTSTTWWQMRGGRTRLALIWLSEHWATSLAGFVLGVAGIVIAVLQWH